MFFLTVSFPPSSPRCAHHKRSGVSCTFMPGLSSYPRHVPLFGNGPAFGFLNIITMGKVYLPKLWWTQHPPQDSLLVLHRYEHFLQILPVSQMLTTPIPLASLMATTVPASTLDQPRAATRWSVAPTPDIWELTPLDPSWPTTTLAYPYKTEVLYTPSAAATSSTKVPVVDLWYWW